jgi:hypothetical protein
MGLSGTVRVKFSSEEAGYLSLTPVVVREMTLAELLEMILAVTGKDLDRVGETLRRGTLVSGASRLRWESWGAEREDLRAALAVFPDPDPARRFEARDCVSVVLKAAGRRIEIPRRTGTARRPLRRRSFWDTLMELAGQRPPCYVAYCYRRRADCYVADLTPEAALALQARAEALRYASLVKQLQKARLEAIEFYVARR